MTENTFTIPDNPVTSPILPANEGVVHTPKQFSDALTLDLTDEEIQRAYVIISSTSRKWRLIFASKLRHANFRVEEAMKLLDQFEDEIKTKLADMDLLATVDAEPVFFGDPPVVELVGALPSHSSAKYGMDHEKKMSEVRKAKDLGQAFLGADKLE